MNRSKDYPRTEFSSSALRRIVSEFREIIDDASEIKFDTLQIEKNGVAWRYDTFEEFIAELNGKISHATLRVTHPDLEIYLSTYPASFLESTVSITSKNRESILRLGNLVDTCAESCFVPPPPETPKPPPPKPKVFIGHGGSSQWRDLKDHLHDQHGYEIISYETGSRAGHTIRDVLDEMLDQSSFAILVMTGEDEMDDGTRRARQNVVHETGLFQGRLGFSKAIMLKEDGTVEFSNIHGVQQIRYSKDNIKETFGDVLAVLKREFG